MNIDNFKKEINENITSTKKLQNELYYKKAELDRTYNAQIYAKEKWLSDLGKEYSDLVLNQAIEMNKCPCSRWGSPLDPDEISANEEGIILTWETNHEYSCSSYDYFSLSWEEILKIDNE